MVFREEDLGGTEIDRSPTGKVAIYREAEGWVWFLSPSLCEGLAGPMLSANTRRALLRNHVGRTWFWTSQSLELGDSCWAYLALTAQAELRKGSGDKNNRFSLNTKATSFSPLSCDVIALCAFTGQHEACSLSVFVQIQRTFWNSDFKRNNHLTIFDSSDHFMSYKIPYLYGMLPFCKCNLHKFRFHNCFEYCIVGLFLDYSSFSKNKKEQFLFNYYQKINPSTFRNILLFFLGYIFKILSVLPSNIPCPLPLGHSPKFTQSQ